jgi:CBS domain-containing protein
VPIVANIPAQPLPICGTLLFLVGLSASRGNVPLTVSPSPKGELHCLDLGERMYQVKDVMHTNVVSIRPEATIETAIQILLEHNISGAPVIDNNGALCGVISQYQLLEVMYDPDVSHSRVGDFMTRKVLTIEEDALLGTAANMFVMHRIRRIPVMRGTAVVGVISRSDLLRYFVKSGQKLESFFSTLRKTPENMPVEMVVT